MNDDHEQLETQSTTKRRLGGVSDMTIFRWQRDRGFPAPIKIAGRNYRRAADIDRWVAQQAVEAAE